MLVTTVVTHNGARHCTPAHDCNQQRPAQPPPGAHTTLAARCRSRCRLVRYSSATLRLRHARLQDTCRTSAQHGLPAIAAAATDNTRATPLAPLQRGGNARVKKHSETHIHDQSTAETIPRSAAPSYSSHSETRCSNAHATTQIRNRNTAAKHRTHCGQDSAGNARPGRASYIAPMTQPH
jgi:hypothetical protein